MIAAVFDGAGTLLAGEDLGPSAFAARHRGGRPQDAAEDARRRFRSRLAPQLRWELVRRADDARAAGRSVVLATRASRPQAEPLAEALGADALLCTELEVVRGRLTGRVDGRALLGARKVEALEALGADLAASVAYAARADDLPLLEAAGEAIVVAPDAGLRATAQARGWAVLDPAPPPALPAGAGMVARSVGFWGGMVTGMSAGLALGAINRSRDTMVEVGCGAGAALALAAAGVEVRVDDGREHLFDARPCVFVFNHQSQLDVPILMSLLETRYTGVGKKEVKKIPFIGQFLAVAGMTFVGRDGRDADALAEPVRKLREEGVSLAIAPEGTRSPTPRLMRFKTGAVRVAQEAGVPIVPILIRNAGELMARDSAAVRTGVVAVRVLPPVEVDGRDARQQTDALRDAMAAALAEWPIG